MSSLPLLSELEHHAGNQVTMEVTQEGGRRGTGAERTPVQGTKAQPWCLHARLRRRLMCRNQRGKDRCLLHILLLLFELKITTLKAFIKSFYTISNKFKFNYPIYPEFLNSFYASFLHLFLFDISFEISFLINLYREERTSYFSANLSSEKAARV